VTLRSSDTGFQWRAIPFLKWPLSNAVIFTDIYSPRYHRFMPHVLVTPFHAYAVQQNAITNNKLLNISVVPCVKQFSWAILSPDKADMAPWLWSIPFCLLSDSSCQTPGHLRAGVQTSGDQTATASQSAASLHNNLGGGQKVVIFRQTATNFWQRRLWAPKKSSFFSLNSPKMGDIQHQIADFWMAIFWQGENFLTC